MVLLGLFGLVASAAAADLTGAWRLDLSPNFSGEGQTLLCTVKQADVTLSADCEGGQFTGKMEGSKVTLQVKTGLNSELTATFDGTVNEAGTAISGKWRLPDSRGEQKIGEFTLTRR